MVSRMLLSAALLAVLSLTGCSTAPKEAEVDASGKKIEYTYVTPTGSNMPVKVRKN